MLAGIHLLEIRPNDLPIGSRRLSRELEEQIDTFDDREFAAELTTGLAFVNDWAATRHSPSTICHGDLFADNMVCAPDGTLYVIDWETVSIDDPLLDLGMAVVGLAQEERRLNQARLDRIIEGYTSVRPLTEDEIADLSVATIHATLIIAFHRYYRHNIRFPNSTKRSYHKEAMEFIHTIPEYRALVSPNGDPRP